MTEELYLQTFVRLSNMIYTEDFLFLKTIFIYSQTPRFCLVISDVTGDYRDFLIILYIKIYCGTNILCRLEKGGNLTESDSNITKALVNLV